ncbi:hypothetical protein LQ327_28510 [Actinomycetospora endophytica]|uniref:Uncharacterized protein n=1 Tax=Actinomycetospora endophytica TaxID=2291215 RepID=A0ABS8PGE4_9PSEU|nr:hypothetical protein [Actinomycetospora endophytica]MCD2197322.1 hypothetical protein [Actinomycetospora endophytica]
MTGLPSARGDDDAVLRRWEIATVLLLVSAALAASAAIVWLLLDLTASG